MTKTRITQLLLVVAAVIVFVLLFIAPHSVKSDVENPEKASQSEQNSVDFDLFVKNAIASLNTNGTKNQFDELLKKSEGSAAYSDSLVRFWDMNRRPDIAAFYVEKQAILQKTDSAWFKAGDRYYFSIQFIKDNSEISALYDKAIACYSEGLKLEPDNIDAKIQLASCYVNAGKDPMKGISMLREVEKTDSNNVKLQMNFAFFSIKSGQYEKAIKRFENVLKIDPAFIEVYLHLANVYEQQGNTAKTIESLENYLKLTDDATSKQEVKKYIEQLKKKLN